jgi:general secretion pathway protein E
MSEVQQNKITLPYSFAKQFGVVFLNDHNTIIYRTGLTAQVVLELQRFIEKPFKLKFVNTDEFQKTLAKVYETDSSTAMQLAADISGDQDLSRLLNEMPKPEDLLESEDDAPIIRLLNALFSEAIKKNASDIHIEIFESHISIRYRVDGVLQEIIQPPRILAPMIISRIKVMAKLDIAEKRLPQDGRISLHLAGRSVDLRVSTMPTSHGERVVMRILDKQNSKLDLTSLGMSKTDLKKITNIIAKPHGIVLVTGPTGSGKTTTLYAALTQLNSHDRNILTIEDPIEYDLPGIGQTQVNTKVDMTFARGLRAMLRQDPDVVMVGEIRDLETGETAVQASLTGHLVFSTLHTNTAVGAITRLEDMGVESFLLSSSLIGVIAQRLVRLLCNNCKIAIAADAADKEILRITHNQDITIYQPNGCEQCNHSGYGGRTGIYEIIPVDEQLRIMIHDKKAEHELAKYAHQHNQSIMQDGIRRVLTGETSLAEILRVTSLEI